MKKKSISDKFSDFQKALAIVVFIIVTTLGALTWFYTTFATAGDVKRIEQQQVSLQQSVDYMQLAQQKAAKEARLYVIQDRHKCMDLNFYVEDCKIEIPKTVKEEIVKLKKDIEGISKKLEKLEK